ncbi:SulP family inorganic anion transporter [Streptomyces sp. CAU 1734]|uniref:SulP family inorganic anion transporter n=1 Tax=Streptomyces sp. CAU 1734 TaxID=3140360 RepID=UPI003260BEAA
MRPGAGRHARKGDGSAAVKTADGPSLSGSFSADFTASIVVFLVALPLCIGVAAASGVPVALGIITGIVGGLIVGFLPGSSLQVSGPAAGLAVLVLEFVTNHGLGLLGPVVLISGLLQMGLGMLKMGRMFQSISLSVVQGMLAGIGVPLILSQMYALVDSKQLGTALKNIAGLPQLASDVLGDRQKIAALALGVMALVLCFVWRKVPAPLNKVPAPLVAVILGSAIAALPAIDIKKVSFGNMLDAVDIVGPASFNGIMDPAVLTMIITFTVIASAESLFSAAAVDRMHTGPRTKYNAELFSQGVGNTICGFLGAMPMTAVIVRSAANVQAGAKTKVSRILHGAWLLGFGLLLPGLLGLIPVTVLAGVLLHAGWKLFNPPAFVHMWKKDRGEGVVMFITTLAIVVANLLEGVLAGLAVAVILVALRMSRLTIRKATQGDTTRVELRGNATFLRLPRLIDELAAVEESERIIVDGRGISHLDLACRSQIEEWADQRRKAGAEYVEVLLPGDTPATPDHEAETAELDTAAGIGDADRQDPVHPAQQPDRAQLPVPAMAQGHSHGPQPHGSPYARQHQHTASAHQHATVHQHTAGHPAQYGVGGGAVNNRPGHQPAHYTTQQSQVHLPHHQVHGQPYASHPAYNQPPEILGYVPAQDTSPEGMTGQGTGGQGHQPQPDGTHWRPEDDWTGRQYEEGTRR